MLKRSCVTLHRLSIPRRPSMHEAPRQQSWPMLGGEGGGKPAVAAEGRRERGCQSLR